MYRAAAQIVDTDREHPGFGSFLGFETMEQ